MHVKEWCTKPCVLGSLGLILAGFGTLFIFFWEDIFQQQLSNVSIIGEALQSLYKFSKLATIRNYCSPHFPLLARKSICMKFYGDLMGVNESTFIMTISDVSPPMNKARARKGGLVMYPEPAIKLCIIIPLTVE